ncbi:hypothetical protein BJ166DRAFT_622563 [Pestalotiopsis sp. NC0098]|nr:hypothetical protein BJ166DRAFT_622563 [Pestalotiopsis sp. NC0098]
MTKTDAPISSLLENVDPYALFEALTGQTISRDAVSGSSNRALPEDYDHVADFERHSTIGKEPRPDRLPKNTELNIGAINPYALVEALLGHRLDYSTAGVAKIISDVLQTDYDELFDLKHESVLFAGLNLNEKKRLAEKLPRREIKIVQEQDLQTPDLSKVHKLEDLKQLGLEDPQSAKVKAARMQNGKLRVVLDAPSIARTLSNRAVTRTINELAVPFRVEDERSFGVPPVCAWRNIDEVVFRNYRFKDSLQNLPANLNSRRQLASAAQSAHGVFSDYSPATVRYDGPVQGATSNSWLIAAIFSVFWADPTVIHQVFRGDGPLYRKDEENNQPFRHDVELHDKGGRNNAASRILKVAYEVPINKTMNEPVYCRASGGTDYWPALYEKAFAMWITGSDNDRPDITQTAHGDPVKAMAQIDGREPQYFFTENHHDAIGLVRRSSVNFRTKSPMCAFTYASGNLYRGANLVANHAYSILGWSNYADQQYIIIRNPWGVTEPRGLVSYPGLLDRVEPEFWPPAALLDEGGVMAIEATAFSQYFACIGKTE